MIWGGITVHDAAGLYFLPKNTTMNGERYLTLLQEKLEFYVNSHQVTTLMHDGAPCHHARKVTDWLQSKDIQLLEWPGNSPDCSPIENLWSLMEDRVVAMQPTSVDHMQQCIKEVWRTQITPEYCKALIHSMPSRMEAVIAAKGYCTKY